MYTEKDLENKILDLLEVAVELKKRGVLIGPKHKIPHQIRELIARYYPVQLKKAQQLLVQGATIEPEIEREIKILELTPEMFKGSPNSGRVPVAEPCHDCKDDPNEKGKKLVPLPEELDEVVLGEITYNQLLTMTDEDVLNEIGSLNDLRQQTADKFSLEFPKRSKLNDIMRMFRKRAIEEMEKMQTKANSKPGDFKRV